MAHQFTNSKWLKVFLADIIDAMPYLKASKSHFAAEMKGKKTGRDYFFSLNDAGHPEEGLNIKTKNERENGKGNVQERQVKISLVNMHSFVDLDVLESVVDIESFDSEIGKTYGIRLGAEIQSRAVKKTFFDASAAFVDDSNGWKAISAAGSHMKSIRNGAKVVGFFDPVAEGALTIDAINGFRFGPSDKGTAFYAEASVGRFQGVEYVYTNDIPNVTGKTRSLTVSAINVVDGETTITVEEDIADLQLGEALKLTVAGVDAKACNAVGMPVNAKFTVVVQGVDADNKKISCGRIEVADIGSRNCFIDGVTELSGLEGATLSNILTDGTEYFVAQIRSEDVMNFDNVPMDDLIGAENKSVNVGGVALKVTVYGDGDEMRNTTRWDVCYGAGIVDNRFVALAYFPVETAQP